MLEDSDKESGLSVILISTHCWLIWMCVCVWLIFSLTDYQKTFNSRVGEHFVGYFVVSIFLETRTDYS